MPDHFTNRDAYVSVTYHLIEATKLLAQVHPDQRLTVRLDLQRMLIKLEETYNG